MSVEDTTLLYSIDHPDLENSFTVTVVPINKLGAGQPAHVSVEMFLPSPASAVVSGKQTTKSTSFFHRTVVLTLQILNHLLLSQVLHQTHYWLIMVHKT